MALTLEQRKAIIALVVIGIPSCVTVGILLWWFLGNASFRKFFNVKKSGDDCTLTENVVKNAIYKFDKNLKCVIDTCITGFTLNNENICIDNSTILTPAAKKAAKDKADAALTIKASKVRIYKGIDVANGDDRYININEVFVYDTTGKNVALNRPVTGNKVTGLYVSWLPQLVDGDSDTFGHTGEAGIPAADESQKNWLEIDLGAETNIKTVVLLDRDSASRRLEGVLLEFYDSAGKKVHASTGIGLEDVKNGRYHTYDTVKKIWKHEKELEILYNNWLYIGNAANTKHLKATIQGDLPNTALTFVSPGSDSTVIGETGSHQQSSLWFRNREDKWQMIVRPGSVNVRDWGMLNIGTDGILGIVPHAEAYSWKLMRGPEPNKYWLVHEPTGKMLYINKEGTKPVVEDFSPEKSKLVTLVRCTTANICT
jgi:hypothetical protein